jgi:glucokinase
MQPPQCFIGLDVGGTMIKALAFSTDGKILGEESGATLDDGTGEWKQRARTIVRQLLRNCPAPARGGVAAPGLPDPDGRTIAVMPGRLRGLEGLNWQSWLEFGQPVPVWNDAQAALLGEVWLGAARGASNTILLTLGTGVGGAVMVDGKLLRGRLGRAGHLGHVSLDPDGPLDIANTPGSLEDAIGEHTLAQRSGGHFSSTRDLIREFEKGSAEAARVWLRSLRCLGAALAGFINAFDPELIVLGGGIAGAGDALFVPLREQLDQFEWRPGGSRVRLARAELGGKAGAAGAAYGAMLLQREGK